MQKTATEEDKVDKEPKSPPFSPSERPKEEQEFFGRLHLRIAAGKDPDKNPELFTPPRPVGRALMKYDWPANDWECPKAWLHM